MSDFIWVGDTRMSGPMVMERITELEAELAVAIELATMARQTFDADGNGTRFLSEIRDDVFKDVRRLAEKSKA